MELFPRSEIKRVVNAQVLDAYAGDPVGFGERVLGNTFTGPIKQLMESVRDNPVTVAVSGNAVGKTHCAARIAIWFYKCFREAKIYTTAFPLPNLKKLLWGEIDEIIRANGDLFTGDKITELNISRTRKQFITGVTIPTSGTLSQREAKFSGKHGEHLLFIFDEGDTIPDEVYKGAESCVSGGHARILIMFNPRQERGYAHRLIRDRKAAIVRLSALDHPNVIEGRDVVPGAVSRAKTVKRINEWTSPAETMRGSESEYFTVPEFLVGATAIDDAGKEYEPLKAGIRKIEDPAFSYMVLGQYPSQAINQLISREWIYRARTRYDAYMATFGKAPEGVRPVMGQDVAEFGNDLNAACFRYGGFVTPIETWGGMDVIETGELAARKFRERNAISCFVDATGIGSGVAPYMRRKGCGKSYPVKVAESATEKAEQGEFGILRDQLWWAVREFLRADVGAMLPPDEDLIEELIVPTYAIVGGKIKVMSKDEMKHNLGRSPDKADSLCLTFAGDLIQLDSRPMARVLRLND